MAEGLLSINKLANIIPEFVDSRLMPSAPPHIKFLLGGAVPIILNKQNELLNTYGKPLEALGILDTSSKQINVATASSFIRAGFSKSSTITLFGFTFSEPDGEALISLMEKYTDA